MHRPAPPRGHSLGRPHLERTRWLHLSSMTPLPRYHFPVFSCISSPCPHLLARERTLVCVIPATGPDPPPTSTISIRPPPPSDPLSRVRMNQGVAAVLRTRENSKHSPAAQCDSRWGRSGTYIQWATASAAAAAASSNSGAPIRCCYIRAS